MADASGDTEDNDFQTTDEESLATAALKSKAKPKPKAEPKPKGTDEPECDEFQTEDDSPPTAPPKSSKAKP
eukprot:6445310-Lingulodinium_polyedra.AAC.1